MSGTVKDEVGVRFESSDGSEVFSHSPGIQTINTADDRFVAGRLNVKSTKENIPMAEVGTPGYCLFENEGTEELTIWNGSSGEAAVKVPAGQIARFKPAVSDPHVSAETDDPGSVLYYVVIAE